MLPLDDAALRFIREVLLSLKIYSLFVLNNIKLTQVYTLTQFTQDYTVRRLK